VTYDSNGFVETITGADGTLRLNRDAMGRVLKTTRQDLSEIDFAYDLLGNLTDLTPPGRDAWTMSHDFRGQMLTLVTPLGSEETYLLDRDGRLVSATMPDGREVSVTYDTSARVDRVVAAGKEYDYVYGEDAYLATVSGGDADVAFEWDGPLLTSQASSGAVSGDISWTWEDGTLALSTMNINGHDVDFTFDKDGMPVQVGPQAITYIRGSSLLREREIADVRVTHAYNDFGELDDLRIRADGELFRVRYTHDDLGRITEARETILGTTTTWSYAYDLVGQLIEVRQDGAPYATYSYDENGNRTDIPGVVHNGDDQLLQYGDTSYTYNAAGQLVEKVRGAELTRYDYSVLGELEQVELPDGRAIDYQHDAMQRRIGRQVDGVQTHRWLWGGAAGPVAEVDANGTNVSTFVYATGINVPDYMVRGTETFALIRDHLGSVRFVVNTATNAIAQELRYDAFGEVLLDTNPGFQPFGYAGGLYDPDTGLTRFGARDYDAHTGRWTARDPIAFGGGQTNLYVYVGNDPINFVDPSGSVAIPVVLGAIWGAIEFGLAVYDVYDFATTMMDSCSTTSDRLMSGGGIIAGAILPGGGYGAGSKAANNAADAVRLRKSLASKEQMTEVGTVMAGPGGRVPFRDASRVADLHGGNAADWVKKTSSSYLAPDGTRFETHWVENIRTAERVEFKTKFAPGTF
jgi:RHS repeat-associated protein